MKKNLIISLLAGISLLSIVFSYYQLQKTNAAQSKAVEFEHLYNEIKHNSEELKKLFENVKKDAEYQRTRNEECQKKFAELNQKTK
jgi:predicted negative regulator of RcsB-dependent stress response